jgi:hypothetical protein
VISRQRRGNPLRCQRVKVSGLTFTRAPRHEIMRHDQHDQPPRVIGSVCLYLPLLEQSELFALERFSAARARRNLETTARRRMKSHATEDSVVRLCVSGWKMEPGMNDQLDTLLDVTRLPTGGRTKFLRITSSVFAYCSRRCGPQSQPFCRYGPSGMHNLGFRQFRVFSRGRRSYPGFNYRFQSPAHRTLLPECPSLALVMRGSQPWLPSRLHSSRCQSMHGPECSGMR